MLGNKKPRHHDGKDKDRALKRKLDKMDFGDAVDSKVIWQNPFAYKERVHEHTTSKGHVLAIKPSSRVTPAEAEMMQFAATHGVPAPQVHGFYEVIATRPLVNVIVSDRVPGVPLEDVWDKFNKAETKVIVAQLRDILAKMRANNTQPFIGRLRRTQTINVFHLQNWKLMGPFDDEDAFDDWLQKRLPGGALSRFRWRLYFSSERKRRAAEKKRGVSPRFVLTHGDLAPRNIMVHGTTITGIIDWERSGFFPEWAEFVFAALTCVGGDTERWWYDVLQQLSLPIDKRRHELACVVKNEYICGSQIEDLSD